MHEGHFTEEIVAAILNELKKYPEQRLRKVTVRVGEVFHLVLDAVLMHFEMITKGTTLEGVILEIKEEHMTVKCEDCGKTGPVEDHHLLMCSSCDSRKVKPVTGQTITIENIEFIQ